MSQLNEIDYFLYSPDDRAGALGFGLNVAPPVPNAGSIKHLTWQNYKMLPMQLYKMKNYPLIAQMIR